MTWHHLTERDGLTMTTSGNCLLAFRLPMNTTSGNQHKLCSEATTTTSEEETHLLLSAKLGIYHSLIFTNSDAKGWHQLAKQFNAGDIF